MREKMSGVWDVRGEGGGGGKEGPASISLSIYQYFSFKLQYSFQVIPSDGTRIVAMQYLRSYNHIDIIPRAVSVLARAVRPGTIATDCFVYSRCAFPRACGSHPVELDCSPSHAGPAKPELRQHFRSGPNIKFHVVSVDFDFIVTRNSDRSRRGVSGRGTSWSLHRAIDRPCASFVLMEAEDCA
ncbi:hypothetical protein AB1N83_010041 [Pleurotus pulmonarius]